MLNIIRLLLMMFLIVLITNEQNTITVDDDKNNDLSQKLQDIVNQKNKHYWKKLNNQNQIIILDKDTSKRILQEKQETNRNEKQKEQQKNTQTPQTKKPTRSIKNKQGQLYLKATKNMILKNIPNTYSISKGQIQKLKEKKRNKPNKIILREPVIGLSQALPQDYCITQQIYNGMKNEKKRLQPQYFIVKIKQEQRKMDEKKKPQHFNTVQKKNVPYVQFDPIHFEDPKIITPNFQNNFKKAKVTDVHKLNQPQINQFKDQKILTNPPQNIPTINQNQQDNNYQIDYNIDPNLKNQDNHNQINYPINVNHSDRYFTVKLSFSLLLLLTIMIFLFLSPKKKDVGIKINVHDDQVNLLHQK